MRDYNPAISEQARRKRIDDQREALLAKVRAELQLPSRLSKEDRPVLARNLGRLIERASRPDKPGKLLRDLADRHCRSGEPSPESFMNKRHRYVRFEDDQAGGEYGATRGTFLILARHLAEMLGEPEDRILLEMVSGASFDGRDLRTLRSKDGPFQEMLRQFRQVGETINDRVDLASYYQRLAGQNVYVVRQTQDRRSGFQWDPRTDELTLTDEEQRPAETSPIILGQELTSGDSLRLYPGKSDQTGDLFSPIPHVLLGHVTVLDDFAGHCAPPELDGVEAPLEALGPSIMWDETRIRREPECQLRIPLHLLIAPDGLGAHGLAMRLDFDWSSPDERALTDEDGQAVPALGFYDLPSAQWETYAMIDDTPEVRATFATANVVFEPAFRVPDGVWSPLPRDSIGGMILANIAAAPTPERIDLKLLEDAALRVAAIEDLFARKQAEFNRAMKERHAQLRAAPLGVDNRNEAGQ